MPNSLQAISVNSLTCVRLWCVYLFVFTHVGLHMCVKVHALVCVCIGVEAQGWHPVSALEVLSEGFPRFQS